MKNFQFEYKGKTYWWSRSVAVCSVVFAKDLQGDWCVLVNKRGNGCPDYNGYWNCPCGYLDCNENTRKAAARELFEETGVVIGSDNKLKFDSIDSEPTSDKQNVVIRYYAILPFCAECYTKEFSTKFSEENEIEEIKFVKIKELIKYNFAFEHGLLITNLYNKYINCSWYKKIIRKIYEKYC